MDGVNFVMREQLDEENVFCNPEECKKCNGACCKSSGCVFSPDDFYVFRNPFSDEERLQYLIAFLKRGYASIDHEKLYDKEEGAFVVPEKIVFPLENNVLKISYEKILRGDGTLYIRMRNEGHGIIDVQHMDSYTTKGCVFLTSKGCKLSFKKRPKGGRRLRPKNKGFGMCIPGYPEIQASIDWYPYQKILFQAYEYFQNQR